MANIYRISSGMCYAPSWKNPRTAEVIPAHSLGTRDEAEADRIWTLEKARALAPVAAAEGRFRPGAQLALDTGETFESALNSYVTSKKRWAKATRAKWLELQDGVLDRPFRVSDDRTVSLGQLRIADFAGDAGTELLAAWVDSETARLEGRTHTVVKRLANFIKPALVHADLKGWFGAARLPLFPELDSDYHEAGSRKLYLTRAQFIALLSELAPRDAIFKAHGRAFVVYPQAWVLVAVSTGMHLSDINRFSEADYDFASDRWYRVNSKGARFYRPEWFPARYFLTRAARDARARWPRHYCGRWDGWDRTQSPPACRQCGRAARSLVAEAGDLPRDWMASRLRSAAKRARLPEAPCPIDFRRTFATWARDEGWEFDEVARWLGNSSGMVREVYAQLENARFDRLVEKGSGIEREILPMLQFTPGPRRGPKNRARALLVTSSETHSKGETENAPNARYQKKEG